MNAIGGGARKRPARTGDTPAIEELEMIGLQAESFRIASGSADSVQMPVPEVSQASALKVTADDALP